MSAEQGNDLQTHDELRRWGYSRYYDFSHEGERLAGEEKRVETFQKCLDVLAFPSDYFPLRILNKLETIKSKWAVKNHGKGEGNGDGSPLFVLTARKMACLYQALYETGFRLGGDSGENKKEIQGNVISDRFAFLEPNLEVLRSRFGESKKEPGESEEKRPICLIDDLSRRGEQLKRRKNNFIEHLEVKKGEELESEVLINLKNNRVDAEHFRSISGGDGVGMIRAYARTFAKALVPYFTDFPVTEKIRLDADQFGQFTNTLKNFNVYEVSTSVGIDEGLRSYTLDLTEVLKDDDLVQQLKQICHVIKLRIFVAAPSDPTRPDAKYEIRVIVKPVFRKISAKVLYDIGLRNELLREGKKCTYHQLGQVFGILQYLVSWVLLRPALEKLEGRDSVSRTPIQLSGKNREVGCIDVAFSSMVLGEKLYSMLKEYVGGDQSGKRGSIEEIKRIVGEIIKSSAESAKNASCQEGKEPSGDSESGAGKCENVSPACLYTLGDDIIQPLDKIVSDHTRAGRNKCNTNSSKEEEMVAGGEGSTDEKEWRRQSFDDLVNEMMGDASFLTYRGEHDKKLSSDEVSFIVGLGLDTLTDWGKIVPDQQAVREEGEGNASDGADGSDPLYRLAKISENKKDLESIYIERCFRAGEITALVTAKTLTGGALSISATSRKKMQEGKQRGSTPWISWAGGKKNEGEGTDASDASKPSLPKDVCLSLLDVLTRISGRLAERRNAKKEEGAESGTEENASLKEAVETTQDQYHNLPCPVIAMTDKPEGVEYALDIFNHFYRRFGKDGEKYAAGQEGGGKGEKEERDDEEEQKIEKLLEQGSKEWKKQHDCLSAMGAPWSFRSFRRLRRAILAVDSLLALLHPMLTAESKTSDGSGRNSRNAYRILDRDKDSYDGGGGGSLTTNDVWEDWVHKLDGPPAPLRYSKADILDSNEMNQAIVVALPDLLGDAWHALTHAFQALCLETETDRPYVSHRVSIQDAVEKIWTEAQKLLPDQTLSNSEECSTCGKKSPDATEQSHNAGGVKTHGERTREGSVGSIKYSPFAEGDVLLTASQIVEREWIFKSGSQWFLFGFSDLKRLVDSGKVIEVVDWQGGKRYPSYQFVRFCLREGIWVSADGEPVKAAELNRDAQITGSVKSGRVILCTDPDYPFLRRDISETMAGSSMAVSGWPAALWFGDMISKTLQPPGKAAEGKEPSEESKTQDDNTEKLQNAPSYLGLLFRESLSQKGLWIDNWLSDGQHILGGSGGEFMRASRKTLEAAGWSRGSKALYRITNSSYKYPDWWASSTPFEEKLESLVGYRNRTIPERKLRGEPEFPAGRFDPGKVPSKPCKVRGGSVETFGALYLADSVEGCVLEVFDRNIAVTLDDVLSRGIYVYQTYWDTRKQQCFDLSGWPALVSATPIRSATQALAGWICEKYPTCELKLIQYPLRTSMELRGFVVLEPTHLTKKEGDEPRSLIVYKEGENELEETANHEPKSNVNHGESDGVALWFEKKSESWDYWRGLESLMRQPHDSVVCFRRFPSSNSADLDGDV